MNSAIILLAVLGCATALPLNDSSLWNIDWNKVRSEDIYVEPDTGITFFGPAGRVIGGSEVTRNSIPYQVAVINDRNGFCGGSLISTTVALTAAHCTISSTSATVILGAHNVQQTEATQVRVATSRIINHSGYNGNTLVNDIALLILSAQVPLNNHIKLITLAAANAGNYAGTTALLSGWGRTSDAATAISPVLRRVNLNVITNAVCSLSFNIITNSNICTSGQGVVGACNGDSGGPLVVGDVQVGVVSFGAQRCQASAPTGYARVSLFRTWIQQNSGV